jgi:chromosome condensin MukBEF ATPase and DNA-binding subunit MukB
MADEQQQIVTIDGAEYNVADLSENAQNQVVNLRVTDAEIEKLKQQLAIYQTACNAQKLNRSFFDQMLGLMTTDSCLVFR